MDFCVQSVSKPLTYCIALDLVGEHEVHKVMVFVFVHLMARSMWVGSLQEEASMRTSSTRRDFLSIQVTDLVVILTESVVNSGAISTTALIHPELVPISSIILNNTTLCYIRVSVYSYNYNRVYPRDLNSSPRSGNVQQGANVASIMQHTRSRITLIHNS